MVGSSGQSGLLMFLGIPPLCLWSQLSLGPKVSPKLSLGMVAEPGVYGRCWWLASPKHADIEDERAWESVLAKPFEALEEFGSLNKKCTLAINRRAVSDVALAKDSGSDWIRC